ncbi:MAG: universal stress protein [Steroidobacteraceae bacterium]
MYARILVPIDGSPASDLGLEEAIKLAKNQGADLLLLHVLNDLVMMSPDSTGTNPGEIADALRQSGDELLNDADARARAAGLTATSTLLDEIGAPVGAAVLRPAQEWAADLIVCGTHGRRGVRRLVLGSDAEYILRHTRIPVLLRRYVENSRQD